MRQLQCILYNTPKLVQFPKSEDMIATALTAELCEASLCILPSMLFLSFWNLVAHQVFEIATFGP